jgi:hypothetical protein
VPAVQWIVTAAYSGLWKMQVTLPAMAVSVVAWFPPGTWAVETVMAPCGADALAGIAGLGLPGGPV